MSTYQLVLNEGLNAVSTPIVLTGTNAEWTTILSGVAFNSIRTVKDGVWQDYLRGAQSELNDFTTMELGLGYLVDVVRLGKTPEVSSITPNTILPMAIAKGDPLYSDTSTYLLGDLPIVNQASLWLQTAEADKFDTSATFLQFTIDRWTEVFIAYDESTSTVFPSWLSTWNDVEQRLYMVDGITYKLFSKIYAPGVITIPGNQNGGGDADNMYLVLLNEDLFPISVSAPANTQIVRMQEGMKLYTDVTYVVTDIPASYESFEWLKLANADRTSTSSSYLSFSISDEANVYVAYPAAAISLPTWLTSFIQLPDVITTSNVPLRLYKKYYTAGTITLGGASEGVATPAANYAVAIENLNPPRLTITLTGSDPAGINDVPIAGLTKGGLSFIGMPKSETSDMSIANVLDARSLKYTNVWRLNRGLWESYVPTRDAILNWSPADFERGKGYLVVSSIDEDQTLEIEYEN